MEGLQLRLNCSAPGVLWPPPLAFPLWRPMKGNSSDVVLFSAHNMPDPSPASLQKDRPHAVLVAPGEELLVGDSLRPEV